jgi:hypothetical protein
MFAWFVWLSPLLSEKIKDSDLGLGKENEGKEYSFPEFSFQTRTALRPKRRKLKR